MVVYLYHINNQNNYKMENLTLFESREKELKQLFKKHPFKSSEKDYKVYSRMISLHSYLLTEVKKLGWSNEDIEKYFSAIRGF